LSVSEPAFKIGARLADFSQGAILGAIGKHVEALQAGTNTILTLGILALWGILRKSDTISLMGFEVKRGDAFAVLAAIIGVQQIAMTIHMLYIQYDLSLIDPAHLGDAIAAIRYNQWIANPFIKRESLGVVPDLPILSFLLFFATVIFPVFLASVLGRSSGRSWIVRMLILGLTIATWIPVCLVALMTGKYLNELDRWPALPDDYKPDDIMAIMMGIIIAARILAGVLQKRIATAEANDSSIGR
jgi:hypothetical protein